MFHYHFSLLEVNDLKDFRDLRQEWETRRHREDHRLGDKAATTNLKESTF